MQELSAEARAEALIAAPAGCVLLLIAEEHNLTPADLAKPDIGLFAIAHAIREISPWDGRGHDRIVAEALRHGPRLRDFALSLASNLEIAWWWAPIDREYQLWLPQPDSYICPEEVWDLRPSLPPNDYERYVHAPRPRISTSELRGGLSSEFAYVLTGAGDWDLDFPINSRAVRIRPTARVLEINSAQDWHDLVRRYPADGFHATHPDFTNTPWGQSDGMLVPDWSRVVRDWDGVHFTPWALLTATQVRVTSEVGWTEPWVWEGAHTLWLNWMFDSVVDLPPIDEGTCDVPYFGVHAFNVLDENPPQFIRIASSDGEVMFGSERGVTREAFGEVDGQPVEKYTLTGSTGMSISILTYGGIIQSLTVPDRNSNFDNVVLGFDNIDDYVEKSPYFGAIVGRYANRIANGRFELDGVPYTLARNNGPNSLHGGERGFDRHIWAAAVDPRPDALCLTLTRTSPDGEERYPGTVDLRVAYELRGPGTLWITYHATTDAPTIINLSNHSYFNLAGEGNGTIMHHAVYLNASHYTPVNDNLIPSGEIASAIGTPLDFTEARLIGDRIGHSHPQLAIAGGYDHNFVVDRNGANTDQPVHVARVIDAASGRVMDVTSDQPGVQFYTGNFLDGSFAGTSGRIYEQRAGFCLETQHFPDSPNQPHFPSTVLRPGEAGFHSTTAFSFGVQ